MSFKPLTASERRQLIEALWVNAESGRAITHAKDTSSRGAVEEVSDREARSGIEGISDTTDPGRSHAP
jgi:hypothetical protein